MAISLSSLVGSTEGRYLPRVLIHAVEGIGKTSLAAEFPLPIYLNTIGEQPPGGIEIARSEEEVAISSYEDLVSAMGQLAQDEHEFKTVIIDTIDGIEPIIWAETSDRNDWKDGIEQPGYGRGYVEADKVWREFLGMLDHLRTERSMCVVMIAHSERVNHQEPGMAPYTRYDIKLQKRAHAIVVDWNDFVLFINSKVDMKETDVGFNKKVKHAEGAGARWIYADARPAFVAKNRSSSIPPAMIYKKGQGFSALEPHIFPQPKAEA